MNDVRATAEMLIHASAREAFDAFVDPRTLERFWLERASAPLAAGATVEWEFMVPGARSTVTVTAFEPDSRLAFRWSDGIAVEMRFSGFDTGGTRVSVAATGFDGADAASHAVGAAEGFAVVLCDLKTLLETGRSGGMVRDKAALIAADGA